MGMACVGSHGAVTLVHRPVVGKSVYVAVLGLVLGARHIVYVAPDVIECQSVDVAHEAAKIQVVVGSVVDGIHVAFGHLLVLEEGYIQGVSQCQHVELHVAGPVVHAEEHPLVGGHRLLAPKLLAGDGHRGVVCLVEAQGEVVRVGTLVQDGTVGEHAGEHADVHPHLHREVAVEEYGVHRLRLEERRYRQRHVVVYGLLVQFGGDDDIVRVDIARHDVLVELDGRLVAVAQDAVGGSRRVEVYGACHVLGDGDDVAIYLDILRAVGRSGEGTELVVALREREVALHLRGI